MEGAFQSLQQLVKGKMAEGNTEVEKQLLDRLAHSAAEWMQERPLRPSLRRVMDEAVRLAREELRGLAVAVGVVFVALVLLVVWAAMRR